MTSKSRSDNLAHIALHVKDTEKSLISNLTQLDEGCSEFEKFYSEYDLNPETPANGYRSFVSITESLIAHVAQQVPATSSKKRKLLQLYAVAAATFVKVLKMLRDNREKGSIFDPTIVTDKDIDILEQVFSMNREDIEPMFRKSVGAFWLKDFSRIELSKRSRLVAFMTHSCWQKVRVLCSSSYTVRLCAEDALVTDVHKWKELMKSADKYPMKLLVKLGPKAKGVTTSVVNIETSSEWIVSVKDEVTPAEIHKSSEERKDPPVRCLLVKPKVKPNQTGPTHDGKSLVVHIHGGAFVLGSPEMTLPLLALTVAKVPVPVLSIDYRLSPEHRYPAAVQDILDVYMFLTSGSSKVQEMIGFQPTNIILTGESAGGNLAVVLTIALKMITQLGGQVIMPKGLSIQVPCAVPGPVGFPANVFFSTDPALGAGLLSIVFSEYPNLDPVPKQDWHRDPEIRNDVLKRLRDRAKDPLFNVLAGNYLDELKDISLSAVFAEFDPILDQGIAIAKKWGGDVRALVARGLPHSLALMTPEKMTEELDWIATGMINQLGLETSVTNNNEESKEVE